MSMTVELTVSDQYVEDLLVTAAEGGVAYWSTITYWKLRREPVQVRGCADYDGAYLVEKDEDDTPGPDAAWMVLGRDAVERGLKALLEGRVKVHPDYLGQIIETIADDRDTFGCALDTTGADIVMQAALFGEIRYS